MSGHPRLPAPRARVACERLSRPRALRLRDTTVKSASCFQSGLSAMLPSDSPTCHPVALLDPPFCVRATPSRDTKEERLAFALLL